MDKKPDWVPEWVWSEATEFIRETSRFPDSTAPDLARKVVFSRECRGVWPVMSRRNAAAEESWYRKGAQVRPRFVWRLLMAAHLALRGPNPQEAVTAKERKTRGTRIARLASDLRKELEAVRAGQGPLPYELEAEFCIAAEDIARMFSEEEAEIDQRLRVDRQEEERERNETMIYTGVMQTTQQGFPMLEAIERGALAWAESSPFAHRPNEAGAARKYFVQRITHYFREVYGTPLREPTACLTRCLFDCNIDAATVAGLSP